MKPFLKSVVEGTTVDLRTPLFNGDPGRDILDDWADILFEGDGLPGDMTIIEYEQMANAGSKSIRAPLNDRLPGIREYWTSFKEGVGQFAMPPLRQNNHLRALSFEQAVERMKLNTNSGWPHFTVRNRVIDESIALASGISLELPAILGWRGQSAGLDSEFDPKQRTVWMYPFSLNIKEMSLFGPLQHWLLSNRPYGEMLSAWRTPSDVDRAVHDLLIRADLREDSVIVSADFSSFDQTIGPNLSRPIYEFMQRIFSQAEEETIDDLWHTMHNIELVISPADKLSGTHGISSGSVFTNLVDTLVQFNLTKAVIPLEDHAPQFQGDDGLFIVQEDLLDQYFTGMENFGLKVSPDKTNISDNDCMYLQRYYTRHHLDGRHGIYPTMRALNSLISQERHFNPKLWGPEMVILRSIMILENCKYHPKFREFVAYVMSGDRYRLGAKLPNGVSDITASQGLLSKAEDIAGFVPSYNQEQRIAGIHRFETVRIIQELGG